MASWVHELSVRSDSDSILGEDLLDNNGVQGLLVFGHSAHANPLIPQLDKLVKIVSTRRILKQKLRCKKLTKFHKNSRQAEGPCTVRKDCSSHSTMVKLLDSNKGVNASYCQLSSEADMLFAKLRGTSNSLTKVKRNLKNAQQLLAKGLTGKSRYSNSVKKLPEQPIIKGYNLKAENASTLHEEESDIYSGQFDNLTILKNELNEPLLLQLGNQSPAQIVCKRRASSSSLMSLINPVHNDIQSEVLSFHPDSEFNSKLDFLDQVASSRMSISSKTGKKEQSLPIFGQLFRGRNPRELLFDD
jgi:hypothetical protein